MAKLFFAKKQIKEIEHPSSFPRIAQLENSIMSESSLKKDWLSPEEEEAWKDL